MPLLNLTLMYNEGAAFSFLANAGGWQRWLFAGFALVMTTVLAIWLLRLEKGDRVTAATLSLIIGGAIGNLIDRVQTIGNLIDRVQTGRVVDFIDFYVGTWHWPAFNVADSAISIGIVFLLITSFRAELAAKKDAAESAERH